LTKLEDANANLVTKNKLTKNGYKLLLSSLGNQFVVGTKGAACTG
jgi:hypothetical protein